MQHSVVGKAATAEETATVEVPESLKKSFAKLQNGSDVRGIALEGIPGEHVNLSPVAAYYIGKAFTKWVAEKRDTEIRKLKMSVWMGRPLLGLLGARLIAGHACAAIAGCTQAALSGCVLSVGLSPLPCPVAVA